MIHSAVRLHFPIRFRPCCLHLPDLEPPVPPPDGSELVLTNPSGPLFSVHPTFRTPHSVLCGLVSTLSVGGPNNGVAISPAGVASISGGKSQDLPSLVVAACFDRRIADFLSVSRSLN
jgi:hypothetical protein